MSKVQTLTNKKGEVEFRKKLANQFKGKGIYYEGEPTSQEYESITKNRIKDYTKYFSRLKRANIPLGTYLELGGGIGQGAMLLENKFGASGFTCDISYQTLRLGDKYLKHLDYKKMPIRICADIYNLPFKSESIPFIFTFQTLHHLPDPKPVLEEVRRVLAPGGYFYFNEEPIAQAFNLNLWRRDRHLRWFEKLLKATVILHFISRIGKAETDNDILEETFSLNVWEKALSIFPKADVSLKVFPFGPQINITKTKPKGWMNSFSFRKILLGILGGGIEALCQKEHDRKWRRPHYTTVFDLLACPNCKHKPRLTFYPKTDALYCPSCKTTFKKKQGIYMLFAKYQQKSLYPTFPSLSIIFPNYNGNKKNLTALLQSIQKSIYPKQKITVTLADNGSTDDSVLFIKKKFPWVNFISLSKNYGFAKAVNIGVKTSKDEYFFITNNDVVLEKNCLKNLIEYLLSHPQVGIIGGKTYLTNPPDKILYSAYKYNFYTGLFVMAKDADKIQEADWIPGAGLCCGRPLWEKLGGFDEDFFFTGEDLDFCLRAKHEGYKILYYPKAILWHRDGATINLPEFSYFKYFESYKSKFRLILKHANIFQISCAFILQFALYLPYRTIILKEKSAIALLQAFLWNIKNIKQTLEARNKK